MSLAETKYEHIALDSRGVPVIVGVLTIACALGAAGLVGRMIPLSLMLQSVVTMIGLGLGIDYGLLLVSRFREARDEGMSRLAAGRVVASRHSDFRLPAILSPWH